MPESRRTDVIELERDLIIGSDDPESAFYNVVYFDLDDRGNVWAMDASNYRILSFDGEGDLVRSFGGHGQGPGEWMRPRGFALAGDRIYVEDVDTRRFSVFDHQGGLVDEHLMEGELYFLSGYGLPDGNIVAMKQTELARGMFGFTTLIQISPRGEELLDYAMTPATVARRIFGARQQPLVSVARPSFTVSDDGAVYFTAGEEYQVLRFSPDGELVWALRVTHEKTPYPGDAVDAMWEWTKERMPSAVRSDYIVPEYQPAVGAITVDGHGHLWVFHWTYAPDYAGVEPPDRVPVDVYDAAGTRLFAGFLAGGNARAWSRAFGDHVYYSGAHPDSEEPAIIRYRLVEPF